MTPIIEKDLPANAPDYYEASLENGSLVMKPYCACGNSLDEDYFCEKCNRKCHCNLIICDNEETIELVKRYARKSSKFSGFKTKLADDV
ncbi:MAG: hypothetical protein B6I22_11545 [Desulfobacteraceae bacterium 4572_123]|nr:MAG: hypothetical protein B6I22_11545 [Desulfobacteraceae bacterium 4572_123]